MKTATYALPTAPAMLVHEPDGPAGLSKWLGDYDDDEPHREFTVNDALAASGDYFITLATRLDKIAQGLPMDSSEQIELEHLVRTLFYLQDNYDIVAKYKRHKR